MTTPGFEAPIALLADFANHDGKIRTANYENYMDLVAISDQMLRKMKFKTGEFVRDEEARKENE